MADDHTNEDVGLGAERPPAEEEDMCLGVDEGGEVDDDDVGRCLEGGGNKGGAGTREGSDSGVEANEGGCERTGNCDGYNSGLESLASDHIPASCESSLISYSGLEGSNRDEEEDEPELEEEEEEAGGQGALDVTLTERSPSPDEAIPGKGRCSSEERERHKVPLSTSAAAAGGGHRRGAGGARGVSQRCVTGRGDRKRPESPGERVLPGAPRSRPTAARPPRTPGSGSQQQTNGDGDRSTSRTSSSSSGCTRSTSRRGVPPSSSTRGASQVTTRGGRGSSRGPSSSVERGATPSSNTPASSRSSGTSEVRRTASVRDTSLSSRKGRPPVTPSPAPSSAREYKRGAAEDDGRWPSSSIRSRRPATEPEQRLRRTPSANRDSKGSTPPVLESKATALEKYATLPRRRNEAKRSTLASVLAAATGAAAAITITNGRKGGGSSSSTLAPSSGRSVSVSREPSLNRAASLRRQRVAATAAANASSVLTTSITSASGYRSDADEGSGGKSRSRPGREKSLPAYPRRRKPVTIYHEASVQTTLTKKDVERALLDSKESRKARRKAASAVATASCDCEVQANEAEVSKADVGTCTEGTSDSSVSKEDLQNVEAERLFLSEQLRKLSEAHSRLEAEYMRQSQRLSELEGEQGILAADKMDAERKLKESMRRVAVLLHGSTAEPIPRGATPPGPPEGMLNGGEGDSSLDELERHLLASGQVLSNQQHEIGGLQKICRNLQKDLDKSFGVQKVLKRQLHEMEAESAEMQEFLLAEKSTLADALRDSESEMRNLRERLSRQEEECKHLVRISEQRRQENMALQARLTGVERRGRELLLQQGAAVSGASVALSGLSSRLDGLVEQLVSGYGISEQELEDVIFHNEAYTQSSSVEASPEKKRVATILLTSEDQEEGSQQPVAPSMSAHPRPSRPTHRRSPASPRSGASFVSAVISAIKSAAAPFSYRTSTTVPQDMSSSSEPSVTPAHEADNSEMTAELSEDLSDLPPARLAGSESLQNLSRAIMQRQVTENEEEEDSLPLSPPHTSPLSSSSSPSDATAEDGEGRKEREDGGAKGEGRSTLTPPPNSGADSLVDQVIEVDNLLTKLLKVLRIIQMENDTYLEEMHEERAQLADKVRTEEDKNNKAKEQVQGWEQMGARLHSELSEAQSMLRKRTKELEEARIQLSKLHEESYSSDRLNEQDHVNELNKKYAVSNKLLADNWRQALTEVRRQYVAIDNALETLHSVQGVVLQCPPLAKLQQDLEEANFLAVSSPVIGLDTDPNANASVPSEMSSDGGDIQENGMKEDGVNGRA